MKILFIIAAISGILAYSPAKADNSRRDSITQSIIDSLSNTPTLANAVWGMKAIRSDGSLIASHNSNTMMLPASNMKIITCGTAIHSLGSDYRFKTTLAYSGSIAPDGTLEGDIYIIGGGDPTIGMRDSTAIKIDGMFWRWRSLLGKAGIRRINGNIIGDGRLYSCQKEVPSWNYEDIGTYYGAGASALSFYGNAIDFRVSAGPSVGAAVNISQTYPETPWMTLRPNCSTAKAGTGDQLYLYNTDMAPISEMRGTFAVDRATKTISCSNKYGAMTCAEYFYKDMLNMGWEISGSYGEIDNFGHIVTCVPKPENKGEMTLKQGEKAASELHQIGVSLSPTLDKIASETLHRSDNMYAEALFRIMGVEAFGIAEQENCLVALMETLEDLGLGENGLHVEDGSGLSRKNYVSPDFLVDFLSAIKKTPNYSTFLNCLPSPGDKDSTLRNVLAKASPSLKSRIYMKSGSMGGVLCYSGYILPGADSREGTITFSILTNNATCPSSQVRATIITMIEELAKLNK